MRVSVSYYSSEIANVTHRFITLNFPLQKDLLVLTKMDKKTYILLAFSGNKIELVEAEVNEETKSVKILKNTLKEEKFQGSLECETFKSEKVEIVK